MNEGLSDVCVFIFFILYCCSYVAVKEPSLRIVFVCICVQLDVIKVIPILILLIQTGSVGLV